MSNNLSFRDPHSMNDDDDDNHHQRLPLEVSSSSSSNDHTTTRSSSRSVQIKNRHSNFVVLVVCYEAAQTPSSSSSFATTSTRASSSSGRALTSSIIDTSSDDTVLMMDPSTSNNNGVRGNPPLVTPPHQQPLGPIIRRKWREFPLPLDEFKVKQWSGLPNDLSLFYYHVPTFKECVCNGINFMSYPNHVIIDTIELERHELKQTECYFVCTKDKYLIKPEHDPVYTRMNTKKQNESSLIRRFCVIADNNNNEEEAQFYLEASNYSLGEALKSYFQASHVSGSGSSRKASLETAFLSSAKLGQTEKLHALLTIPHAFSIDTVNNMGMNALHLAALHSRLTCLNLLLDEEDLMDEQEDDTFEQAMKGVGTKNGVPQKKHPLLQLLNQKDLLGNTPLFYAAMGDSIDCFDLLIQQDDISLFEKNKNSETVFHAIAMGKGNKAIFESYFVACAVKLDEDEERYKSWCNTKNNDQETAFIMACRKNRYSIVSTILDPNQCYISIMDIHLKNRFSQNALIVAAKENAHQTCELLLRSNLFHVNEKDEKNLTALFYACALSQHECISLLLNYGADYTMDYQVNYLIRAVLQGDTTTIQYLLRAGMSPDYRGVSMYDETSVYHHGTTTMMDPIGEVDSTLKAQPSSPLLVMTPLQLCIYGANDSVDDSSHNNTNNTIHTGGASSSPVMDMIMRNIGSSSPRHHPRQAHLIMNEIFQILMNSGADVNLNIQHEQIAGGNDQRLSFPLLDCVYNLNMELFMKLLSHPNINVNQPCIYTGMTCAHFMIQQYYLSKNLKLIAMFRELLKVPSFNVNAQDLFGRTPLYLSNLCGTSDLSKLIMNHPNCDWTLCDVNGVCAHHVCDSTGSIYSSDMKAKKHKTMCFKLEKKKDGSQPQLIPKVQVGYFLQHEVLRLTFKGLIQLTSHGMNNNTFTTSRSMTNSTTIHDGMNNNNTLTTTPTTTMNTTIHDGMNNNNTTTPTTTTTPTMNHTMSEHSKQDLIKFYKRFYHLKKYLPCAYMLNSNKFKNTPHRHDMFCKMIDFELEPSNKIRLLVSSNVEYIETNSLKFYMDKDFTSIILMKFSTSLKLLASIYILHSCGIVHGNIRPMTSRFKEPSKTCIILDYGLPFTIGKDKNDYYTAPEIRKYGYDALCEESDIYSLGAIFYELFFDHKYGEMDMSSSVNHSFKELESVIAACCSENSRDRPKMKDLYQVIKKCADMLIQSQALDDLMTQILSTEVKLVDKCIQTYTYPTFVPPFMGSLSGSSSGSSGSGSSSSGVPSTSVSSIGSVSFTTTSSSGSSSGVSCIGGSGSTVPSTSSSSPPHVWKATNNLKGCIKKLKEEYAKMSPNNNTSTTTSLKSLSEVSQVLDEIEEYYTGSSNSSTTTSTNMNTNTTNTTTNTNTTNTTNYDFESKKPHSPSFLTNIYDILYLLVQTLPDKFKIAPLDVLRLILLDENAVEHLFKTVSGMKLLDELMNRMNQFVKSCSTPSGGPVDSFSITVINSCLSHLVKSSYGSNYLINFKPQHYCTLVNFLIQCFTFVNSEEKCFYSASSVVFNMRFDIYRIGDQYGPILSTTLKELCLRHQHPFFDRDVQAEKCTRQLLDAIVMCLDRIYVKLLNGSSTNSPLSTILRDTIINLAKALYTIMKLDNNAREYMELKQSTKWMTLLQSVIETRLHVAIMNMIHPEAFAHDEELYIENARYKFMTKRP